MDDPDCDPERLRRTYAQFALVNRRFSGWGGLYRQWLRPAFASGARSVLDIGCGGGDLLRQLRAWTLRDGFTVRFTGADTDPRAIAFARDQPGSSALNLRVATIQSLADADERFDIVLSNHLLHHLGDDGIRALCTNGNRLQPRLTVHNDLRRSALAHALFPAVSLLYRDSFVIEDGLRSICRAYTPAELRLLCTPDTQVTTSPPFRLQLICKR